MRTLRIVLITAATFVILAGTALFAVGLFRPRPAGIRVETNPSASIYINGVLVGKTPYKGTPEGGEVALKLVPVDVAQNLFPFETRVTLASGIETVIRREFGTNEDTSSGDVISFEKIGGAEVGMVVISTPDNAQISIDGVPRGFAPYKTSTISPAEHQVTVKASGYSDRIMTIKTLQGYKLTLFAKLAKSSQAGPNGPTPSPTPQPQVYVLILGTPTGYLRVRTQPQTAGEEIAQVAPGEKYLYLGTDAASGWFKIQYEAPKPGLPGGITGWVSGQYAKLVDTAGASAATPSATPSISP